MPVTRNQVAQQIATSLRTVEAAIDQACAAAGEHFATLSRSHQEAKFAASVGHHAMKVTLVSLTELMEARAAALEQHEALEARRLEFGLTVTADGDKPRLPPPSGELDETTPTAPLRIVANQ